MNRFIIFKFLDQPQIQLVRTDNEVKIIFQYDKTIVDSIKTISRSEVVYLKENNEWICTLSILPEVVSALQGIVCLKIISLVLFS